MLDLGVRCGQFLAMAGGQTTVRQDIFLGIEQGLIKEISPFAPEKAKTAKEYIDASKMAAMPGLVNAHTHLAMTLFRGLKDDVPFHEWLFDHILPLEAALVDSEFVRVGTELAALECIRFGVTTVADMYFYSETIAEVIDRAGLRAWISQVLADGPLPEDKDLGRDKFALFEKFHARFKDHARITPVLGPHAPYTCSDALLLKVAAAAKAAQAGIQIHVAETQHEVDESQKLHGKTPVKRLSELGILGPRTVAAHCVHFSEQDIKDFKVCGSHVVYNPDSNLKLSSGIAPITRYLKEGLSVALGTDGAASNNNLNLFGAMNIGAKTQKQASGDNTAMVAADALRMATIDGARALGLEKRIGSLEIGKEADFILIDLEYPHLKPLNDLCSHLVYSLTGLEVDSVFCAGRALMREKRVKVLDQERIFKEAEAQRARIQLALSKMIGKSRQ